MENYIIVFNHEELDSTSYSHDYFFKSLKTIVSIIVTSELKCYQQTFYH